MAESGSVTIPGNDPPAPPAQGKAFQLGLIRRPDAFARLATPRSPAAI